MERYSDVWLRKVRWREKLASLTGIHLSMLRWDAMKFFIDWSIGFNLLYRFLLNWILQINFGFDWEVTDFYNVDLFDLTFPIEVRIKYPELRPIQKARYGITKYGEGIYDPPQPTSKELEEALWDLRYKATTQDDTTWNQKGIPMLTNAEFFKDIFEKRGVKRLYLEGVEDTLAWAEGVVLNCAYVGFSVVGVSKVMPRRSLPFGGKYGYASTKKLRNPKDWEEELEVPTFQIYETQVGFARVGYCRVMGKERGSGVRLVPMVSREVTNVLRDEIKGFRDRTATTWQRVFFYQRQRKLLETGGRFQIHHHNIINLVRQVCDEKGIIAQIRQGYIAFAKEIAYLKYKGHVKYTHYKTELTEDEIIEKWKRRGLDESVMREILHKIRGMKLQK